MVDRRMFTRRRITRTEKGVEAVMTAGNMDVEEVHAMLIN